MKFETKNSAGNLPTPMKQNQAKVVRLKVLLYGSKGAGKSTYCQMLANPKVSVQPTLGVDTYEIEREINGQLVYITLFDFSGDPLYKDVRNEFYNDGQAVLFCVDMTSKDSQLEVNDLTQEFGSALQQLMVFVIGMKSDKQGVVQETDIAVLAQRLKAAYFITSQTQKESIMESFSNIVQKVYKRYTAGK